nr:hypothetical protein CFP56_00300 [Quercus suber]
MGVRRLYSMQDGLLMPGLLGVGLHRNRLRGAVPCVVDRNPALVSLLYPFRLALASGRLHARFPASFALFEDNNNFASKVIQVSSGIVRSRNPVANLAATDANRGIRKAIARKM